MLLLTSFWFCGLMLFTKLRYPAVPHQKDKIHVQNMENLLEFNQVFSKLDVQNTWNLLEFDPP